MILTEAFSSFPGQFYIITFTTILLISPTVIIISLSPVTTTLINYRSINISITTRHTISNKNLFLYLYSLFYLFVWILRGLYAGNCNSHVRRSVFCNCYNFTLCYHGNPQEISLRITGRWMRNRTLYLRMGSRIANHYPRHSVISLKCFFRA